ncbi:hypothetical protein NEOLEDRAFT_1119310 [Neolentinus lepideus HHB14362 ss-1]|uniref:P-loop containing nucleoside triphosphate hydrolase protein n=1 Tax=Neolentinus lepideus HHB14362 ss-1 TaxID=1314782 RepID=A0A165QP79_9AGAM|nr:hypothetical protein NEOLEDRAFT_1119310 [Neolentinus lepideus HHB14362 ss-1]
MPLSRKKQRFDQAVRLNDELVNRLEQMNGKPYPAYRDLEGCWKYPSSLLFIDHVQNDPYAPPSRLRLRIEHATAKFPSSLYSTRHLWCSIYPISAAADNYLTRIVSVFSTETSKSSNWHGTKGGDLSIDKPGQQVLERSSITLDQESFNILFTYGFPAQGGTILGDKAAETFRTTIPRLISNLLYETQNKEELKAFIESIEDQEYHRQKIKESGLVAFVANGAVLPRASGASDKPMKGDHLVKFHSPKDLEHVFTLPNRGEIRGIGIPAGITLIAGGGFHGKSTLLNALAYGCYNHVPGDGRDFVVTSSDCVAVRGDDGRSIGSVDISPFISNLPGGTLTTSFSTTNASGSTSMAAGVMEALELGADLLLFDEDTCATNFLIRDRRMQRLISSDPITPLIFKVRAMFKDHGCSSILVIGGCGDYCDVADLVLEMRDYSCYNITENARRIAVEIPSGVPEFEARTFGVIPQRQLHPSSIPVNVKTSARGLTAIQLGEETVNLFALVQLAHESQTRAILNAFRRIRASTDSKVVLNGILSQLQEMMDRGGLNALTEEGHFDGFLARPRLLELGMAVNRIRSAVFEG